MIPGLDRDGQVVAIFRVEVGLVLRIRKQVIAVVYVVGVAIIRNTIGLAAPGKDAITVARHQVPVAYLILHLLGNLQHVAGAHDVAGPVRGVDDDVEWVGPGDKAGANLLEEIAEGKFLELDLATGLIAPLFPEVLHRAGDLRAGLGRNLQSYPRAVQLTDAVGEQVAGIGHLRLSVRWRRSSDGQGCERRDCSHQYEYCEDGPNFASHDLIPP